jgi:prevent-host-death family protein
MTLAGRGQEGAQPRHLLREAQGGEQIAVTFRGEPVALLVPFDEGSELAVRPYRDAWPEIKATLRDTRPAYRTPERAMKATRRRGA